MSLTLTQIRTLELGALGLPPNATAAQVNAVPPKAGVTIDPRTGLPYTPRTAQDAGGNQLLGQVVGAAGLGVLGGEIAAGLGRLGGAVAAGDFGAPAESAPFTATGGTGGSAAGGAGASAGTGAGEAAAGAGAGNLASNIFKVAKFASVADFLAYIAWIFHPQTILRAVEFILGLLLMAGGVYILTSRGRTGGPAGATARRIVSLTPAGRVIRVSQGRRMGRHEGQREAARMEARQAETRSQREASALEREQINRRARQNARS